MKPLALIAALLWFAGLSPALAEEATSPRWSPLAMAQKLVELEVQASPLVREHAADLIAGKPTKSWKNCVLEKELEAALRARHEGALQAAR